MAGLPPRPVLEPDNRRYPPEDRHYAPSHPIAPLTRFPSDPYYRDSRSIDRYPPARPPGEHHPYDHNHDSRRRWEYDRDRDRDRDRGRMHHENRRDGPYDRDRGRERDVYPTRRESPGNYERRRNGDAWEPNADYNRDRRQIYERDRSPARPYPPRHREPPPFEPQRDSRSSRSSRSPRRSGAYDYPPGSSYHRSGSPRRRPPSRSPPYRPRPRSPSPRSRSPKRLKLGDHSIDTGSHSPPPRNRDRDSRDRDHPPDRPRRHVLPRNTRSISPAHREARHKSRSRSRTPEREKPKLEEHASSPIPAKRDRSPSFAHSASSHTAQTTETADELRISGKTGVEIKVPSLPPPLTPGPQVKPQSPLRVTIPSNAAETEEAPQSLQRDKGKAKEEAPTLASVSEPSGNDGDVKMRDRSPSPHRHPSPPRHPRRGGPPRGGGAYQSQQRRASPPRGPRNHNYNASYHRPTGTPVTPHASASSQSFLPRGPRGDATGSPATSPAGTSVEMPPPASPQREPSEQVVLPFIPRYVPKVKPKPQKSDGKPDGDAEEANAAHQLARLQAQRAKLDADYQVISKATRRAVHEFDISSIDLRAAETRRRVADTQLEKARAGVLGVDADTSATSWIE